MRNTLSIARRIIIQIRMDKRSLALVIVAPILVLSVFWLVLNTGSGRARITAFKAPEALAIELSRTADLSPADTVQAGLDEVRDGKADAFLDYSVSPPVLTMDGADSSITGLVAGAFQQSMVGMLGTMPLVGAKIQQMKPEIVLLHGKVDAGAFAFISPLIMGFIIFFFIFVLSGVSFLRERSSGTLDRLLVSPTRRMEIVLGYVLGFGFYAVLQTVLIQAFMIYVLSTPAQGGFLAILLINLLLCLVGLSLGSFISAFARNEFQVFQFIPIVIVPQILFSGIFNLRDAPQWLQALSWLFPMSYGGTALRDVMVRGRDIVTVLPQIAALLAFSALFMTLNSLVLKKRPG